MVANADTIWDLAAPKSVALLGGVGPNRSFIFEDTGAFNMNSVAISVDANGATNFTASLYNIIGDNTLGSLIVSNSALLADTGADWYNVLLGNSFSGAGNRYVIDFTWDNSPVAMERYLFEGQNDFGQGFDPAYSVGPITMIDGKEGGNPVGPNFWLGHFKIEGSTAVPEPGTLALFGLGLAAMGLSRRRKKI
jgi:hypothetical protein